MWPSVCFAFFLPVCFCLFKYLSVCLSVWGFPACYVCLLCFAWHLFGHTLLSARTMLPAGRAPFTRRNTTQPVKNSKHPKHTRELFQRLAGHQLGTPNISNFHNVPSLFPSLDGLVTWVGNFTAPELMRRSSTGFPPQGPGVRPLAGQERVHFSAVGASRSADANYHQHHLHGGNLHIVRTDPVRRPPALNNDEEQEGEWQQGYEHPYGARGGAYGPQSPSSGQRDFSDFMKSTHNRPHSHGMPPPPPGNTPPPPPASTDQCVVGCPPGNGCFVCAAGTYQPGNSSDVALSNSPCMRCPVGSWSLRPGATSCDGT